MRFKEELKPKEKTGSQHAKVDPTPHLSYHSHLIDPGTGLAFLASKPQARTWPCSSYNRQVGTFLKVSIDPGQCRICCTFPAAIRDEPYAYDNTPFDRNTAEDADTTYHARESSSWTPKTSVHVARVAQKTTTRLTKVDGNRHLSFVRGRYRGGHGRRGRLIRREDVLVSSSGICGARSSQRAQRTRGINVVPTHVGK